jgi:hypothetical protein
MEDQHERVPMKQPSGLTAWGHEDPFPRPTLNGRVAQSNGRDAPFAAVLSPRR